MKAKTDVTSTQTCKAIMRCKPEICCHVQSVLGKRHINRCLHLHLHLQSKHQGRLGFHACLLRPRASAKHAAMQRQVLYGEGQEDEQEGRQGGKVWGDSTYNVLETTRLNQ